MITALAKLGPGRGLYARFTPNFDLCQISFGEICRIEQSFRIDCNLELSRIFKCKNYSVVFCRFSRDLIY